MEEMHVPSIDRAQLEKLLKEDFERCMEQVTQAVNEARVGAIIDESEEAVRVATGRLRQKIFEKAIQMKTDAAEAAFSPSEGSSRSEAAS